MRRNRLLVGLTVAILVALVASFIVYRQVQRLTAVRAVPQRQIVVAAGNLPLGTRLDASKLRLVPWSGDVPVAGSFARIEDCAGRALVTPVVENEMILDGKLAQRAGGAGLPSVIPEGMRAVSIPVNDVMGVAGFVVPGTWVDVLVTGSTPERKGVMVTKTILEKVRVLATGQDIQQDKDGKPVKSTVVTLLVSPADADRVAMAALQGRVQLALRNTVDSTTASPPAVEEPSLFSPSGPALPSVKHEHVAAAPKPSPAPPVVVEVIYGSKRETKSFPNP
jgi:pilus assembly protein CpaB